MQKIISLFMRNYGSTDHLVRDEVTPGAEWVVNGEGTAYRKWDGTAVKIENGHMYKRYDCKLGTYPPPGFIPSQNPDPITGHWPGWILVDFIKPENKWHVEGWIHSKGQILPNGTYELCGPKIGGNPEGCALHILIPHLGSWITNVPTTFQQLHDWFMEHNIEGIVWHHPDGRMVKIKKRDFGLQWPPK